MLKKLYRKRQATASKSTGKTTTKTKKSQNVHQVDTKKDASKLNQPQTRASSPSKKSLSSRKSSKTASTAASSAASTAESTAVQEPNELDELLATQIVSSAEESLANILTGSGSDITTGPIDDVLFALGGAINRGANEVEEYVENKFAQGLDSIRNTWDRFQIGLLLMFNDNSTIATDFTESTEEVVLVKCRGAGEALEIVDDTSASTSDDDQTSQGRSVGSDIKSQVQALIDSFFLYEM